MKSVSREESSTGRMGTSIRTDPIVQTSQRTTLNATLQILSLSDSPFPNTRVGVVGEKEKLVNNSV